MRSKKRKPEYARSNREYCTTIYLESGLNTRKEIFDASLPNTDELEKLFPVCPHSISSSPSHTGIQENSSSSFVVNLSGTAEIPSSFINASKISESSANNNKKMKRHSVK